MKNITDKSKTFKIFKIIIINIFFLIMVLGIIDYSIYSKFKKEYIKTTTAIDIYPPISYINNYKADFEEQSYIFQERNINNFSYLRLERNINYKNKESILLFGCSFTYGAGLETPQTFARILSKSLKKDVYNFGICATGIQHMFNLIENNNIYSRIYESPSHIIYTFIPDHLERLQANIFPSPMMANGINLKYKIKNDKLEKDILPFNLLSKTFIVKGIYYQLDLKRNIEDIKTKEYSAKLAYKLFIESKKLLEEKYPNIKFVILRYEVEDDNADIFELPQMWNELEKDGFIIIKSSDLIGRKYKYNSIDTSEDKYHPSEHAWNLLVPKLIEKLNLK